MWFSDWLLEKSLNITIVFFLTMLHEQYHMSAKKNTFYVQWEACDSKAWWDRKDWFSKQITSATAQDWYLRLLF